MSSLFPPFSPHLIPADANHTSILGGRDHTAWRESATKPLTRPFFRPSPPQKHVNRYLPRLPLPQTASYLLRQYSLVQELQGSSLSRIYWKDAEAWDKGLTVYISGLASTLVIKPTTKAPS